ncbi:MAG: tetratricopeptide repeat protein [Rhodoluna sp.]|nr:tetratricopeptide repeat protein [Rhodoluna sp.]
MTIEFGKSTDKVQNVPALVIQVDANSIRDYLAISDSLPVLVLFVQENDPASQSILSTVKLLTEKTAGKILTLVVDAVKSPELAQAFDLKQIPSLLGMLKGQPAPLFVGDQPAEQVQQIIERVLQVGKENGLTGTVKVAEPEPELSPTHQQAFAAIEENNYPLARSLYEKALVENPNDQLAEAGLAQIKLLIRLEGKDLPSLVSSLGQDTDAVLARVDALVATGAASAGFEQLLVLFESTAKDQREPIRLRFVELFLVVGNEDPAVIKARKNLSLLLF